MAEEAMPRQQPKSFLLALRERKFRFSEDVYATWWNLAGELFREHEHNYTDEVYG